MVSRRSFLKLLSSVPAVAALPAVAQAIEHLPAVDDPQVVLGRVPAPPEIRGIEQPLVPPSNSWLTINGVPVQVQSMHMDSRQDWIPTNRWQPYGDNDLISITQRSPGLLWHTLHAEVLGYSAGLFDLHDAFLLQQSVQLVARFGDVGEFRATGTLTSYSINLNGDSTRRRLGGEGTAAVEFYLRDVEWVPYK